MLQDLSSRLARAVEQKHLKHKLARDLQAVTTELQEQSTRLAALKKQLEKEEVDVRRLEKTSLTSLFQSVLGSREEQLEKERQELLAVQLRYQQTSRRVTYLQEDKASLEHKLSSLKDIERTYSTLLKEKEQVLLNLKQDSSGRLLNLAEQMAYLEGERNEVSEALAAGSQVLAGLDQIISSLESAESWGTFDLIGGGILSTVVKHSRINDARSQVSAVQADMQRFQRELSDVGSQFDLNIEISQFEFFADHFIDNLITDWIVQSKIKSSLENCRSAKLEYVRAVNRLESHKKVVREKLDALQAERNRIIEDTK